MRSASNSNSNADLVTAHGGEINRHVGGRKGVGTAAVFGDDARILFRPDARRAFEHHVLEKMRQAALAVFFIARTDAIPNLKRDRRALVIFEQKHFKTVVENHLLNISGARERIESARA